MFQFIVGSLNETKNLYTKFKESSAVLTEGYFKMKFQNPLAELSQLADQIKYYYNIFDELSDRTAQAVDFAQNPGIGTDMEQFGSLLTEISLSLAPQNFPE